MKKNGFTLVELLAVIAILAILVIIALPNIIGMFTSAKKSAFTTEVKTIQRQAETDFMGDSVTLGAGGRFYCSEEVSGQVHDGTTKLKCKKLNITTTKNYYIEMLPDGTMQYLGVSDNSFAYGKRNPGKITDISDDAIDDISKYNNFNVKNYWYSYDDAHTGEQYTITFNRNGGTGGPSTMSVTYGEDVPSITVPTTNKTVYKITYNANGSGATLPKTSENATWRFFGYTPDEDELISGHVYIFLSNGKVNTNRNEYTINGKWSHEGDVTLNATYSNSVCLPTITVTGKTCRWCTNANCTTQYYPPSNTNGVGCSNFSPASNVTLYAKCQ